jgi:hypothetical protein
MPQFNISVFLKKLSDCLNEYSTQSATFNLLFNFITYNTDKYGFDFSDKKISNIMNGIEDIPENVRNAANDPNVIKAIKEGVKNIVVPSLRYPLIDDLMYTYGELIQADSSISPKTKKRLLTLINGDDICEALSELFLYVLNIPFKKHDEFREIYYCSSAFTHDDNSNLLSVFKQQYSSFIDLDKGSNKELEADKAYKLTANCSLESVFVLGSYMTNIAFKYSDKECTASTSCANWISQSELDNFLSAGNKTFTMVFKVLNVCDDNKCQIHIYLIGELYK